MFEVYLAWTALLRVLLHTCASLLLALNRLKTFKNFGFSFTSQKLCLNKSSCLFLSKILKHAKMTKVAVFVGVACMFGDGSSGSGYNRSVDSLSKLEPPQSLRSLSTGARPPHPPKPLPPSTALSFPALHTHIPRGKKALSSVFLLFLFHHLWPPPFFTKLRTQPLK